MSAGPSPQGSVSPCPAPSAQWRLASPETERRVKTVGCDDTESNSFTPKKCFKTVREVKLVPECKQVTKQVCDSKWEINAQGEKVFASNENCRDLGEM